MADIGTHWMDLAQYLVGEAIQSVNADLATFHPRRLKPTGPTDTFTGAAATVGRREAREVEVVTDDHAAVLLRFEAGIRGAFHVSQVTAGRKNRLTIEIAGTEASVAWDSESPDRLWIGSRRGPNQLLARDPALLGPAAAAMAHYPGGHVEGFPDTFKQLYIDVYGWIVEGRTAGRSPASRPSPTATARSGSARPSPAAPPTADGPPSSSGWWPAAVGQYHRASRTPECRPVPYPIDPQPLTPRHLAPDKVRP